MRLTSLHLTNFRGFSDLTLPLDPQLTVLVGQNGSGKSTILDAIYQTCLTMARRHDAAWTRNDERPGAPPPFIELSWVDGAARHACSMRLVEGPLGALSRQLIPVQGPLSRIPDARFTIVNYRMNRSDQGDPMTPDRLSQFHGLLLTTEGMAQFTPFERLVVWFRQREDLENQERVRRRNFDYQDPALTLARSAIVAFLGEDYSSPRIDRQPSITELLVDKKGIPTPATQLSDGERSLLAMAGDLASQIGSAELDSESRAIVLIDEIELHLHPSRQRRILPAMLQAFPRVQFIVTTHSPQVLGEVEAKSIRILENFALLEPSHPVKGRDANALLREIMRTTERPAETEQEIKEIGELLDQSEPADGSIDRGKLAAAREKLRKLRAELGETDSEVIRLDTALLFAGETHVPEDDAG